MSVAWLFSTTNTSYKTLFWCHFQYSHFWIVGISWNIKQAQLNKLQKSYYGVLKTYKNQKYVFRFHWHTTFYEIKFQRTTNWGKSIISHSSLEGYNTWFDKCEACTPYCYINFYINVTPYQYSFYSILHIIYSITIY